MILKARGTIGDVVEWKKFENIIFSRAFCLDSILLSSGRSPWSPWHNWSWNIFPCDVKLWWRQSICSFHLLCSFRQQKEGDKIHMSWHPLWVNWSWISPRSRQCPFPLSLVSEGRVEDSNLDSYYTEFPSVAEYLTKGIQVVIIRASIFLGLNNVPRIVLGSSYTLTHWIQYHNLLK